MSDFFKSRIASFSPALAGLTYVLRTQKNAWIHLTATVFVILVSLWFKISFVEFAILFLAIGLVWVSECLNTGLEAAVNLISPHQNHLAKIAKDAGAAGVLAAAITSVFVGLAILGPPFAGKIMLWLR